MLEVSAHLLVALTGLFFVALGAAALFARARARRFLLGFAATAGRHYLELGMRLLVGGAFVLAAPRLAWPSTFLGFGWLLLGTTAVMVFVPWRLHHRFAQRNVPPALKWLPVIGVVSTAFGVFVLGAAWHASTM